MSPTLDNLRPLEDVALFALRVLIGLFLIWGVWDNIVSTQDMAKFVDFLRHHGFPLPEIAARASVAAQFLCGVSFVLGMLTRWAGLLCAINFTVAIAMVDYKLGIRGAFPAACLVAIGLYLAARGGGRYALDAWIDRPARPERQASSV